MRYSPHPYQQHSTQHLLDNPAAGLFLEMGLGKTVATLMACDSLLFDSLEVDKILVIAPLLVAENVWTAERDKWDQLNHIRIAKVLGTERERKIALNAKSDIWVINRENVAWLIAFYGLAFPFDMVIIDELSSFKSAKSMRFKALRKIRPLVKRVVGLTGTPAPNSLIDLWSEMYLLDQGERLGQTLTGYRDRYFTAGERAGPIVYKYNIRKGSQEEIYQKIGDICISMKTKDYLNLPPVLYVTIDVVLSDRVRKLYDDFERDQVLALVDNEITAVSAAALATKLLQFANGAIYDEVKDVHEIHSAKLEALEEIIEVSAGQPVIVFYWFKHDLERIMRHLKRYKPRQLKSSSDIDDWNAGRIPVFLLHPASAGHGLNMQDGGNIIVWFGHTWSLELYQQANARLPRPGQKKTVIIHKLVTVGTMDLDVIKTQDRKAGGQDALMDAVKARILKYT
jgi:SNF2 family DNA or RNA helicase